jgi:hypothetical protein
MDEFNKVVYLIQQILDKPKLGEYACTPDDSIRIFFNTKLMTLFIVLKELTKDADNTEERRKIYFELQSILHNTIGMMAHNIVFNLDDDGPSSYII